MDIGETCQKMGMDMEETCKRMGIDIGGNLSIKWGCIQGKHQ